MPRMGFYIEYSTRVYQTYLRFIAPEDIVVHSIDEVFIDATAGIGTNLYLAKVAMDIVAKKMPADKDGARIAELAVIGQHIKEEPNAAVTYFLPDTKKAGGQYVTVTGNVEKLDGLKCAIIMADAIITRRSTRKYKPNSVEPEKLEKVVEAGRYAPSGNNKQTSHFLAIQSAETLGNLASLAETAFARMEADENTYPSSTRPTSCMVG